MNEEPPGGSSFIVERFAKSPYARQVVERFAKSTYNEISV